MPQKIPAMFPRPSALLCVLVPYFWVFLLAETLLQNLVAARMGAEAATGFVAACLFCLAVGYLSLQRCRAWPDAARQRAAAAGMALSAVFFACLPLISATGVLCALSFACFVCVGYVGGVLHHITAMRMAHSSHTGRQTGVTALSSLLLAALCGTLFWNGQLHNAAVEPEAQPVREVLPPPPPAMEEDPDKESAMLAFARRYPLTKRETDVLLAVLASQEPLGHIAEDMQMSERVLQRHLTAIYTKSGTGSRVGLLAAFYGNAD